MSNQIATLPSLLELLAEAPESALIFNASGAVIRPGYHLTEVKLAEIRSVDCGRNTDSWSETVVQLLDGPAVVREDYMPVGKFVDIASQAMKALPPLAESELWFEFSPGNGPHQKLRVAGLQKADGQVMVDLAPARAACKPFEKAKAESAEGAGNAAAASTGCCGSGSGSSSGCCAA